MLTTGTSLVSDSLTGREEEEEENEEKEEEKEVEGSDGFAGAIVISSKEKYYKNKGILLYEKLIFWEKNKTKIWHQNASLM